MLVYATAKPWRSQFFFCRMSSVEVDLRASILSRKSSWIIEYTENPNSLLNIYANYLMEQCITRIASQAYVSFAMFYLSCISFYFRENLPRYWRYISFVITCILVIYHCTIEKGFVSAVNILYNPNLLWLNIEMHCWGRWMICKSFVYPSSFI